MSSLVRRKRSLRARDDLLWLRDDMVVSELIRTEALIYQRIHPLRVTSELLLGVV